MQWCDITLPLLSCIKRVVWSWNWSCDGTRAFPGHRMPCNVINKAGSMERGKILVKNQKEALAGPDPPPWFHFSIFTDQHTRQKMVALWTVTHKHVKQKILVHTHTHTYYWLPSHTQIQLTQLESLPRILPLIITSSQGPTWSWWDSKLVLRPKNSLQQKKSCAGVGALFQVPVIQGNTIQWGGQFD